MEMKGTMKAVHIDKLRGCFLKALTVSVTGLSSVPARLGKGQGAKEIGYNLARERPKFGHNLVRNRHRAKIRA